MDGDPDAPASPAARLPVRLELGAAPAARCRIAVWGRAHPGGLAVFDDNWLNTEVAVAGVERGWRYHAFLRAGDFARLAGELRALEDGSLERAAFEPRDPWVAFWLWRADGGAQGRARLRDGGSERGAEFGLRLDDAALGCLRRQVEGVTSLLPPR